MKKLEKEFVRNADQTGNMTFRQIKRTDRVAMYERRTKDNRVFCYEVFVVKIVPKGTVFAKGAPPTTEDAESYPGARSFGRLAKCVHSLEHAEHEYKKLIDYIKQLDSSELVADGETEVLDNATEPGDSGPKRGRKAKEIKMPIPKKGEKFTMKRLMAWSGESHPNLYNRLKVLIEAGLVGIAGEVRTANTRGKAQILYVSYTDDYAANIVVDGAAASE